MEYIKEKLAIGVKSDAV